VLCLQEVTWTPGYQGWVTYTDSDRTSRQRSSLFDDVRRALPEHQAQFVTNDTGPVLCEDGTLRRQHFGIATFIAPHLSLIGAETAYVHGAFAHHDEWPAQDRGRLAHAVRVAASDGSCTTAAHFHGVRMQAERVAALVSRVRRPDDVVVLAGDMNILPNSETFDVFGQIGLTDLVGSGVTRTSAYVKPVRHANYLLVSDPAAVASFEVLAAPEVSDHRPLVLDLDSLAIA
jgi:endonuclease/exonuclease/phosphatase (EEP) superfamily protein YafD